MRHLLRWLPVIAALLPHVADAQDVTGTIAGVSVGFRDIYKVGYWTPVWVTLKAEAGQALEGHLTFTTRDGDGAEVRYLRSGERLRVPAGQEVTVVRRVKFGRVRGGLAVDWHTDDGEVTRRQLSAGELPQAKLTDSELLLTIGPSIGEEGWLAGRTTTTVPLRCQVREASELPADWLAYEAVDTIIIATADNPVLEAMTAAQFRALRQWVQMGGRLVLSVGARGQELCDPDSTSVLHHLAGLVPGEFTGVNVLTRAAALESYGGSSHVLEISADEPLFLTTLRGVSGGVELSDAGVAGMRPLVVRAPHGLGEVVFVSLDLDRPPLSTWEGRSHMVGRLLRDGSASADRPATSRQGGRMAHVGFTDMAGQLRSALDQFTGVSLVPFYWVAGLVFLYTLLVGPGDYFFLRRVVKRMHYTWLTFPLLVIIFSVCAVYLLAQLKDDRLRINQVDLVDVDLAESVMRGSAWADIYSPRTETYDLCWHVDSQLEGVLSAASHSVASWQGLPGTGLGGLNTNTSLPGFTEPYEIVDEARQTKVLNTPIQISATKAFQVRWWGEAELELNGDLYVDSNRLAGQLENPLPIELTECSVFFGQWLYRLESHGGALAPGDTVQMERESPGNLEWRLTRRRIEDARDVSTPWNQNDLEVPRILEMMMFHGAAGGDRYTQLKHRYQGFVDLSQQLRRGRAVLVGRGAQPATHVEIDGSEATEQYDRTWTFYRVVFPVAETAPSR